MTFRNSLTVTRTNTVTYSSDHHHVIEVELGTQDATDTTQDAVPEVPKDGGTDDLSPLLPET